MGWPTKHGMARTPTYNAWALMKDRCKPTNKDAKHYAERGIGYEPEWECFENFLRDMGERPAGMSLDRKDNDKSYSKANCRWATAQQQAENKRGIRRIDWGGETMTMTAIAKRFGVPPTTLRYRIDTGIPLAQALTMRHHSIRRLA